MDSPYRRLAAKLGLEKSERIAGLFAMLADETAAEILLALPGQAPDVAEKLGLEPSLVEEKLNDLYIKGVAFPYYKVDPPSYRMCRDLIQFHDASILWPEAPREFLDLWREYMEKEWYALAAAMAGAFPKPFTRVIPVGVSIHPQSNILDFESVAEIIDQARNITVSKCTCRLTMGKCDHKLEACLQVNKAADYNQARGTGRKISKQEALDLIRECEEEGLVHVTMNRAEADNFICNCCPCCCQALPVLIEGGARVVDPSRFRAEVDPDECDGCGLCHERCYFGAVEWSDGEGSASRVLADKCMGCGLCLVTCPTDAIKLIEAREPEFIPSSK